ncbi:MAG: tetratricopeptide repeat protein [Bacteroidetes bacterium]|nr:tetratricopeptide repeat protein [Bacteroidota bacterium]
MKKVIFISLFFVVLQPALFAQQTKLSEEGYKNWIKAGERMKNIKQESDYYLVLNDLLKVLETDSQYADAFFNMGIVYSKIGEFTNDISYFMKAKECYEKHLVLDPSKKSTTIKALAQVEIKIDDLKELIVQQEVQERVKQEQELLNMKIFRQKGSYTDNNGNKLSNKEIKKRLGIVDPELEKRFKRAKDLQITGWTLFAVSVGFGITYPIASLVDGDLGFGLGIMGGCLGAGFLVWLLGIAGGKKAHKTITTYNEQVILKSKNNYTSQLYLGLSSSGGIGLTLKF